MELMQLLRKLKTNSETLSESFNIFSVLAIETKEVLTCRLIGALLDPNGKHGMGCKPLIAFAENCLEESLDNISANNCKVVLEEVIDGNRRVDIVIHTYGETEKCYPIEVKIGAGDQTGQLYDYLNYYQKGKFKVDKVYYLTPTGWNPSEKSRKGLKDEQIKCISFRDNISRWLQALFDDKEIRPETKMILDQFKEVVEKMCKKSDFIQRFKEELHLGNDFKETDELRTALNIMDYAEDLKKEIRCCYLERWLYVDDSRYEIVRCEGDNPPDKNSLLTLIDKENKREKIAWICVETNLYLVAEQKFFRENREIKRFGDKKEDNKEYWWMYIKPEGYSKERFALRDLKDLPGSKIDLSKYLKI